MRGCFNLSSTLKALRAGAMWIVGTAQNILNFALVSEISFARDDRRQKPARGRDHAMLPQLRSLSRVVDADFISGSRLG